MTHETSEYLEELRLKATEHDRLLAAANEPDGAAYATLQEYIDELRADYASMARIAQKYLDRVEELGGKSDFAKDAPCVEWKLKAAFLDRIHDDPEGRIASGKSSDGYWIDYVNDDGWPIFRASGHTLTEAIRNFLDCEGEWEKKKPPTSGA